MTSFSKVHKTKGKSEENMWFMKFEVKQFLSYETRSYTILGFIIPQVKQIMGLINYKFNNSWAILYGL